MAASLNKVTLIGKLGKDPEMRSFANGNGVCNLSVATSERWTDKASGEKKEKTEWHKINVFNEHIIKVIESFHVGKGDTVYVEGQLETRKYEKDGREVYTTEIVLKQYQGEFKVVASANKDKAESKENTAKPETPKNDMDSEIPF